MSDTVKLSVREEEREGMELPPERNPIPSHYTEHQQPSITASSPSSQLEEVYQTTSFLVPLPSLGKIYPEENPLHGQEFVEIRHMEGPEEDILTTRSLLRSGKAIDRVIKACLINKNINLDSLILGDKNAIMVALRISSYGAAYKIPINCPECNELHKEYEFDLGKLEMKQLEIDPVIYGENYFAIELPYSKLNINFKFLNSEEEKEVDEVIEKMQKMFNSDVDKRVTTRLKRQIVSINNNIDKKQINDFVDHIHAMDSRYLRNFIAKNEPDIEMKQNFTCRSCGVESEVEVPITSEFFFPTTA